ncbi:MAG TPA: hypothetical protein VHL98_15545 [Microvirga sp.]|jgi:uncharacterized Ntn-hydrolase superfamily protein|nr:hypothetical protein [Microvirga sp.]
MNHRLTGIAVFAALAASAAVVTPALAQAQKPAAINMKAIPAAERSAMGKCVDRVLDRLKQERASYRAVKPAIAQDCDTELRAVLAAAIKVGQAGPCTTVDGCIEMARGRAGDQATEEFQRSAARR